MKAAERQRLKENDFVRTVEQTVGAIKGHRDQFTLGAIVVAVVILGAGGYFFWSHSRDNRAGEMFGEAMAITESPISPPSTLPGAVQAPGTYPTDKARQEAALAAFQAVAKAYPSTNAGMAGSYQAASALLTLDRLQEAEQAFQDVATRAGSGLYGPLARLGLAETYAAERQFDKAIPVYNDLAAQRDGTLPVDGILMQLGQTCVQAGRTQDARAAFKRVVDEFPESTYVQSARQQLAQISAS